jgi:transaldolase
MLGVLLSRLGLSSSLGFPAPSTETFPTDAHSPRSAVLWRAGRETNDGHSGMDRALKRILVGVDGSAAAAAALGWAGTLARTVGADVLVATVFEPDQAEVSPERYEELTREAAQRLGAEWSEPLRNLGVTSRPLLLTGSADALLEAAEDENVDLVVVGPRGHGSLAHMHVGSLAHHLAHHTTRPLAIVPKPGAKAVFDRIVVGVDGSEGSAHAVRWCIDLARATDAEVIAVYACEPLVEWVLGSDPRGPRRAAERKLEDDWVTPLRKAGVRCGRAFLTTSFRLPRWQASSRMKARASPLSALGASAGSSGYGSAASPSNWSITPRCRSSSYRRPRSTRCSPRERKRRGDEAATTVRRSGSEPMARQPQAEPPPRGRVQQMVDHGIRGVTANPTILQRAIAGSADYDDQLCRLARRNLSVEDVYWDLVIDDVERALEVLRPVFDRSEGNDGFVSVELPPSLAGNTGGSVDNARSLHQQIDEPNLFVNIPATDAGIPAIRQMISEGQNINISAIFSLERYDEVIEAYLSGLEAHDGDLSRVHSVASFLVSRVDTEVDGRLSDLVTADADALLGKVAVAQATLAYQTFQQRFRGPRWEALTQRGACRQRPLWASTATKNVAYPDTFYVDSLIGRDTVNTMPETAIAAFEDHGTVSRTIDRDVEGARALFERLSTIGIDMNAIGRVLEDKGLAAFAASYDGLLQTVADRASSVNEAR